MDAGRHGEQSGNLLLNVGPTGRGEFDYRALERLEAFGAWMKNNSRSIYGCTASEFTAGRLPYTQNGSRLYLHFMDWPFGQVHLPGLAGKVEYAQFLHDASEVKFHDSKVTSHDVGLPPSSTLTLALPTVKPNVEIPVIEIFLKH